MRCVQKGPEICHQIIPFSTQNLFNVIPVKIVPLYINARLPLPFPLLEALLQGCLWYCLQVIHHISEHGINCLKSSIMGNIEFREHKKSGGDRSGE
jgi:hypothetical protein